MSPGEFFWAGGWLLLAVLGLGFGVAVNWAVYELAYDRRPISPWSRGRRGDVSWVDRLPVWGWWQLRREEKVWGKNFWIRPMLVELFWAGGLPALYYWEVVYRGIDFPGQPADLLTVHIRWAFHAVLFAIMMAGSLIDVDEKTLPDALTVPGTWLGLVLAACYPWLLLPDLPGPRWEDRMEAIARGESLEVWVNTSAGYRFVQAASPGAWPASLEAQQLPPLGLGLGLWWFWCFALMDRRWYSRLGLRRAWWYFWARLVTSPASHFALAMGIVGTVGILLTWLVGGVHWQGLLSALIGLGMGAGLVWLIRLLGGWALRREAMGFGDVILMAFFGTVVGWQGVLMIFFLAPLVALAFGIVYAILGQGTVIPYGPFLCLANGFVILFWQMLWPELAPIFRLGWILPLVLCGCLLLLPPLLVVVRVIRELIEAVFTSISSPSSPAGRS